MITEELQRAPVRHLEDVAGEEGPVGAVDAADLGDPAGAVVVAEGVPLTIGTAITTSTTTIAQDREVEEGMTTTEEILTMTAMTEVIGAIEAIEEIEDLRARI